MLTHLCYLFLPATITTQRNGDHPHTIINHLKQNQVPIRARRPYTGQFVTAYPGFQDCYGQDVICILQGLNGNQLSSAISHLYPKQR